MKSDKVKDFMVPVTEYASVSEDATLYEALTALEASQKNFEKGRYPHRGVLVMDSDNNVVAKISQLDILRALEPKYFDMQDRNGLKNLGFSKHFMKSMLETYRFLDGALDNICKKAGETKVSAFMSPLADSELIDVNASLNEAIHHIVMGQYQSLLITGVDGKVMGILRITDIFSEICQTMHTCGI